MSLSISPQDLSVHVHYLVAQSEVNLSWTEYVARVGAVQSNSSLQARVCIYHDDRVSLFADMLGKMPYYWVVRDGVNAVPGIFEGS